MTPSITGIIIKKGAFSSDDSNFIFDDFGETNSEYIYSRKADNEYYSYTLHLNVDTKSVNIEVHSGGQGDFSRWDCEFNY